MRYKKYRNQIKEGLINSATCRKDGIKDSSVLSPRTLHDRSGRRTLGL